MWAAHGARVRTAEAEGRPRWAQRLAWSSCTHLALEAAGASRRSPTPSRRACPGSLYSRNREGQRCSTWRVCVAPGCRGVTRREGRCGRQGHHLNKPLFSHRADNGLAPPELMCPRRCPPHLVSSPEACAGGSLGGGWFQTAGSVRGCPPLPLRGCLMNQSSEPGRMELGTGR